MAQLDAVPFSCYDEGETRTKVCFSFYVIFMEV